VAAAAGFTPSAARLLWFSVSWQPAWMSSFSKQEMQNLQYVVAMLLAYFVSASQIIFAIQTEVC
jgi:hypothetical protein